MATSLHIVEPRTELTLDVWHVPKRPSGACHPLGQRQLLLAS